LSKKQFMTKSIILFTAAMGLISLSKAQTVKPDVVNCAGQTFSVTSNSLSFNVGESFIGKITNGTNQITQGFLQPKVNTTAIKENNNNNSYTVYPNPTINEINVSAAMKDEFSIKVLDNLGREMPVEKIGDTYSLSKLRTGIYQLLIIDKSGKAIENKIISKID